MAFASPWRRAPSTIASSVHSIVVAGSFASGARSLTMNPAEAEGGIAVEEALGSKPNRELGVRHHWIILRAGNMSLPQRIPDDDVPVINGVAAGVMIERVGVTLRRLV